MLTARGAAQRRWVRCAPGTRAAGTAVHSTSTEETPTIEAVALGSRPGQQRRRLLRIDRVLGERGAQDCLLELCAARLQETEQAEDDHCQRRKDGQERAKEDDELTHIHRVTDPSVRTRRNQPSGLRRKTAACPQCAQ